MTRTLRFQAEATSGAWVGCGPHPTRPPTHDPTPDPAPATNARSPQAWQDQEAAS